MAAPLALATLAVVLAGIAGSPLLCLAPLEADPASALCGARDEPSASPAAMPLGPAPDVDARLQELHSKLVGLPGFVDVYHYPGQAQPYRALFVGAVPAEASRIDGTLGFDVLAEPPVPLGAGPTPDVNDVRCTGIRPGALLSGICTASFVFEDSVGDTYLGTAGHCFPNGATVSIPGVGAIGTVVYSINGGVGADFALIKINASKLSLVSPEMCNWAGPTGTFNGVGFLGEPTVQTGHGSGVGIPTILVVPPPRPKTGVGLSWGATSFTWVGSSIPGDSGSAIRTEVGDALGTVTHLSLLVPVMNFGTRWDEGIDLVEGATSITGLTLETVSYTHP